jgi:hypothetical protein
MYINYLQIGSLLDIQFIMHIVLLIIIILRIIFYGNL